MSLSSIATKIWEAVSENDRQNSATTIAVIMAPDKTLYCTANDVHSVSATATNIAKQNKIQTIGGDYISLAGAGFHAEMWAVMQALTVDENVSKSISSIGASRACCKYCTAVLQLLKVGIEQKGDLEFVSWYNPLTMDETCNPRKNFKQFQQKNIPDFRNHSRNYWFTTAKKYQDKAPDYLK